MKGPSGLPTSGKSSESILARIALLRFLSPSATLPPFMRRERDRLLPRTFANASESSLIAESLLVPSVCVEIWGRISQSAFKNWELCPAPVMPGSRLRVEDSCSFSLSLIEKSSA